MSQSCLLESGLAQFLCSDKLQMEDNGFNSFIYPL